MLGVRLLTRCRWWQRPLVCLYYGERRGQLLWIGLLLLIIINIISYIDNKSITVNNRRIEDHRLGGGYEHECRADRCRDGARNSRGFSDRRFELKFKQWRR